MARVVTSATPAQARFLATLARSGGFVADCLYGVPASERAPFVRAGLITVVEPNGAALTWAGWNAVPRMFAEQAARAAGIGLETFLQYVKRGEAGAPPPDGYAVPPDATVARPERFWWPWTVQNWAAGRDSRGGRRLGERQCVERDAGKAYATCRAAVGSDGVCTNGHAQAGAAS